MVEIAEDKNRLFCIFNIMVADGLATQGARASVARIRVYRFTVFLEHYVFSTRGVVSV